MIQTRIIPLLLLNGESLVKTVRFNEYNYIGDPANTVKIFNELEVDELIFLDITDPSNLKEPNFKILSNISSESFMPLSYGGKIRNIEQVKKIFDIGFEKVSINSQAVENKNLISQIANIYGTQAIIVSIDVKKNLLGNKTVRIFGGTKDTKLNPTDWAKEAENLGAGEILLTSIDKEGTWDGFDVELVSEINKKVNIPVIANGGAGKIEHISEVINKSQVSAVALGSMVVYQKKGMGVLVNFPNKDELLNIKL